MTKTIKPLNCSQMDKAEPDDKDDNLFEDEGMCLLVRQSDAQVWMLQCKDEYNKFHKIKFGSCPEISLSIVREKQLDYTGSIAEGNAIKE